MTCLFKKKKKLKTYLFEKAHDLENLATESDYKVFSPGSRCQLLRFLLHRYAGLHEDPQRMFESASTIGNLLRRTLRAYWMNWINRMNYQWEDFVFEKLIYNQKISSLQ